MDDSILRKQLISLLQGGNAHMSFDESVKDFPISRINDKFPKSDYSTWDLIEHMCISQADILDFIVNPHYKELNWPDDYWPDKNYSATENDWNHTIQEFNNDLLKLQEITTDSSIDLQANITHGNGQNTLRELMLVSDHNAYHIGELGIMRQVMGTWGKNHK